MVQLALFVGKEIWGKLLAAQDLAPAAASSTRVRDASTTDTLADCQCLEAKTVLLESRARMPVPVLETLRPHSRPVRLTCLLIRVPGIDVHLGKGTRLRTAA